MIEPITTKLRPAGNTGIFHDSRADARTCMNTLNICINKINELVKAVTEIQEKAVASAEGGERA